MSKIIFVSHPEVVIDPNTPVPRWHLSDQGTQAMRAFAHSQITASVGEIWASTEAKAIEAAGILAARLGLGVRVDSDLDENDRSATGFLPPDEFQAMADAFFANPETSVKGWERAVDAQSRVKSAFDRITHSKPAHDIAIVGHGGTGTLLFCALAELEIDRSHDQPGQGHFWCYDLGRSTMRHGWQPIAGARHAD